MRHLKRIAAGISTTCVLMYPTYQALAHDGHDHGPSASFLSDWVVIAGVCFFAAIAAGILVVLYTNHPVEPDNDPTQNSNTASRPYTNHDSRSMARGIDSSVTSYQGNEPVEPGTLRIAE